MIEIFDKTLEKMAEGDYIRLQILDIKQNEKLIII